MTSPMIDLLAPDFIANPYPHYSRLRENAPIYHHPSLGWWFISSYEDVNTLLKDRRLGRALTGRNVSERSTAFEKFHSNAFMEMEPPDHTRLRSLVHKVFTPARVEDLRSQIEAIATSLLAEHTKDRQCDLIADFAVPLPVEVIAELLGIPASDRHLLRPWSHDIVAMYELKPTEQDALHAEESVHEFSGYLHHLADHRRQFPGSDLFSALVQVQAEGNRLSKDELIATAILLLNAGHEATVNAIGNGVLALLKNSDQLTLIRQNPSMIRNCVEEMLRYDTPLQLFKRWVLEDFDYKGIHFQRGDQFALLYGAANRDPARFTDPDQFWIQRPDNQHLTFGAGIHYCLGAPLARLEIQISVQTLLKYAPNLFLLSDHPTFRPTYVIRGLNSLMIGF